MEKQKNQTILLSWSITSEERRKRTKQFLHKAFFPFCIIALVAATVGYPFMFIDRILQGDFRAILGDIIWMIGIGVIGVFLLMFLVNKIFPYAERRYQLTETEMHIAKNRKEKTYQLENFESFALYSPFTKPIKGTARMYPTLWNEGIREGIMKTEKTVMGSVFYLRKKQAGILRIAKRFVVVYTTPENSEKFRELLASKLPEKEWKLGADSGLTFYEFK
jgi:hypothetical protein